MTANIYSLDSDIQLAHYLRQDIESFYLGDSYTVSVLIITLMQLLGFLDIISRNYIVLTVGLKKIKILDMEPYNA